MYLLFVFCFGACVDLSPQNKQVQTSNEEQNNDETYEKRRKVIEEENKKARERARLANEAIKIVPFPPRFVQASATQGARNLAGKNNNFAVRFYSSLQARPNQKGKNLFFSPISLHTALGMLQLGTTHVGEQELAKVLGVEGLPDVGKDFYNLQGSVLSGLSANAEIALANAMFIDEKARILPEYQNKVKQHFETDIFKGSLKTPQTIQKINNWVNQSTRGKIPTIVDEVNEDVRLILLNAIYFRSIWEEAYKFKKEATKDSDFTLANGLKKQVPMMYHYGGNYLYTENAQVQIVAIPYKNKASYLYVVLPKPNVSLANIENNLNDPMLNVWIAQMQEKEAELVAMPKIKIETTFRADTILQNMGAKAIFDESNPEHLLNIDGGFDKLFVAKVLHKTFLDINEEGTEAAAIIEIEVEDTKEEAPPPPKKFTFIANRPFLFFIREANLGTILFMGRVMNPLERL